MVHGFTQTGRSWDPVAERLAARLGAVELVAPDLPGHGSGGEVPADTAGAARMVGERGGHGVYVGYSLGGRVALQVALERPDLVERLVLVSATAGIEDDEVRAERRAADEELAQFLESRGVDAFLERWLSQDMFATLAPSAADLAARRGNTAAGLAAALRHLGQGSFTPVWARLAELAVPVLVVAGEHDDAYCREAMKIAAWIGEPAAMALVPGAGHACHLEQPDLFADLVVQFLELS